MQKYSKLSGINNLLQNKQISLCIKYVHVFIKSLLVLIKKLYKKYSHMTDENM